MVNISSPASSFAKGVLFHGNAQEFREFNARGIIEIAVAFIINVAFGKIVSSLVNDVIMPPIGLLLGNVDFSNMFIDLDQVRWPCCSKSSGSVYGAFINTLIKFLMIAPVTFLIVRQINKMQKKEEKKNRLRHPSPARKFSSLLKFAICSGR